jgi:hypothetical protein
MESNAKTAIHASRSSCSLLQQLQLLLLLLLVLLLNMRMAARADTNPGDGKTLNPKP